MLLAEDDPLNRKVTTQMLRRRGYDVVAVDDGRSAVLAVESEAFDAVLMDIQMPGMDGVTAAREVRAVWGRTGRPAPIIAFTGNMSPEELVRGPEAFDGFVAKPFRLADLTAAIDRAVADFGEREQAGAGVEDAGAPRASGGEHQACASPSDPGRRPARD